MPLAAGTRLGPYEIVAPLGAGGMGDVYKARDTRLDRTVAIKVARERFTERFEREARAIAALNHPNICALYDVGPDYLVMEFVDGAPLKGPLPPEKTLALAVQIAEALEEAHRKGVVHRDLKPGNILVTASGAKLLDFGLAKMEAPSAGDAVTVTATQPGTLLGTAAYMAPEQAEGRPVDARSDIFAFGLVLYEMLSGQRAFGGDTMLSTVAAILHKEPRPLDAPPHFARIVARCLKKNPGERFQTAADVKAALQQAGGESAETVPSIAVLPFANLSADKENEYFSDGLSEEIINALTQVPGLKVTARTSAFSFRGKDAKIADIARELGVAHVLEGSVRKAGNRIRVTAQLIKAADGFHLWSERYDRELNDVFAIQDEISAAIVNQLKVNLTGRDSAPHAKRPANLAAYEAVLEGRHNWYRWTPASLAKALGCFERATSIDPNYAPGHAGIAEYYVTLVAIGLAEPRETLRKAAAAARRALALEPNLAEANGVLAAVSGFLDYDWAACGRYYALALEQNPAAGSVRFRRAFWYLRAQGRAAEALEEMDRLLAHDPLSPSYRFGKAEMLATFHRYGEAADWCRRALDIEPGYFMALWALSLGLAMLQRYDEALATIRQAIQSHGKWSVSLTCLATIHAMAGDSGEARRVLDEVQALAGRSYVPANSRALIYYYLGDDEAAWEWLEKSFQQRDPFVTLLGGSRLFERLSSDPRFPALLRKMNLES